MFYALLVFAALTSTISMHEIGTAFFTEEFHMPRKYAAWVLTIIASVLCVLCSWSVGAIDIKVLGVSLMDFCDQLTANVMLPLGGMLACLFVGWYIPRQLVFDEFTNNGQHNQMFYRVFLFAVRYVCPVCIILVFLHQLGIL
jgi:NSS family neurotransmitter:Na+ symporter